MNSSYLRSANSMKRTPLFLIALSLGGAFAAISACSSSNEQAPSRPPITTPDSAVEDVSVPDAATDAATCFDWDAGTPTQLDDYLNACTDGQCTKFDNATRVPLYVPGQPLPPVP